MPDGSGRSDLVSCGEHGYLTSYRPISSSGLVYRDFGGCALFWLIVVV